MGTVQLALKYNCHLLKTAVQKPVSQQRFMAVSISITRNQPVIRDVLTIWFIFLRAKLLPNWNRAFVFLQRYANSRGTLQSLYMISDLPKWGLLRFTVGDYNDGLCHIAAIRREKLGLGVDSVRIGQWIRPDFSQNSNALSEAPLLTTYNQRTGSLSQSPSPWGWRAGSLCLDRDPLCRKLKL